MKRKTHVLVIHGGMTFKNEKDYLKYLRTKKISTKHTERWASGYLSGALGRSFEVINPRMPLAENAKYRDWVILFERYLSLLKGKYILIGASLGGVFLAKYLSENKLRKKAISVFLVCPPFDNSLPGEDLVGGFTLKPDLSLIEKNCKNLHLLFSKDDDVVPVAHADKYQAKLTHANVVTYKSKNGHFNVKTFPEIVRMIRQDARGK